MLAGEGISDLRDVSVVEGWLCEREKLVLGSISCAPTRFDIGWMARGECAGKVKKAVKSSRSGRFEKFLRGGCCARGMSEGAAGSRVELFIRSPCEARVQVQRYLRSHVLGNV